jgi:hypothetical protein
MGVYLLLILSAAGGNDRFDLPFPAHGLIRAAGLIVKTAIGAGFAKVFPGEKFFASGIGHLRFLLLGSFLGVCLFGSSSVWII